MRKKGTQCSSHHDLRTAASPSWCRGEQLQASLLRDQRVGAESPGREWLTGEASAGQAGDLSSSPSVHYSLVVLERSHNPKSGAC